MFRAVSWLPTDDRQRLLSLPEVASADPILVSRRTSSTTASRRPTSCWATTLPPELADRGRWPRAVPSPGPARSCSTGFWPARTDYAGRLRRDRRRHVHRRRTVRPDRGPGNFYAFVSLPDAARLLRAGNRFSHFLVQPRPGYTPEQAAAAIRQSLPGMDAMTSAEFAHNSRDIIISMVGRPLKTMIAISTLVGVVLVGPRRVDTHGRAVGRLRVLRAPECDRSTLVASY